jgi:glutamate racemase
MIGVFDSGVGGLGVLNAIRKELPSADLIYLADQGRAPYGVRSLATVAAMTAQASQWLLDRGATTITIACNTASAAAIHRLRALHPEVPFVGMEPALKPATLATDTGVIGVLATAATFQGELFASLVQRHGEGLRVLTRACPNWVELVEAGMVDGPRARHEVESCLAPVLEAGADTLVLGCTHFAFLMPVIEDIAGSGVTVIDPAPAIARQVGRVAKETDGGGETVLATSGDPSRFAELARRLAGIEVPEPVLACTWNDR